MHFIKNNRQKGIFLILTIMLLIPMLFLIALMVDIGRLVITARNLQVAAEGAALAGVERLRKCDASQVQSTPLAFDCSMWPPGTSVSGVGGWQAVKPAVITALSSIKLVGAEPIDFVEMNTLSTKTRCDLDGDSDIDGFGDLQYQDGMDETGAFTFKVERLFECVKPTGELSLEVLEANPVYNPAAPFYHYCLANAVRVTLTYTGHKHLLATLMGFSPNTNLNKSAVARIRPTDAALACNFPSCDLMHDTNFQCSPVCPDL